MFENKKKGVESMATFSNEVLQRAKDKALQMIGSGKALECLNVGERDCALFVSADPAKVTGSQTFRIGKEIFYLGLKQES